MEQNHLCQYCGSNTYEDIVRMCLWEGDRLVVIEGIPARVCETCLEQFYDDLTAFKIDKLRATKFPIENARRVLQVPVFSLPEVETKGEENEPVETKTKGEGMAIDYSGFYEVG